MQCQCDASPMGIFLAADHHYLSSFVVSGMQLLRLLSAICRHHLPQMAVLSQIYCLGERKVVLFQILLDGAEQRDTGTN